MSDYLYLEAHFLQSDALHDFFSQQLEKQRAMIFGGNFNPKRPGRLDYIIPTSPTRQSQASQLPYSLIIAPGHIAMETASKSKT